MEVTQFVTQLTHVLRHLRVLRQKKKFRNNCFDNVISDLWKSDILVNKTTLNTKKNPSKRQQSLVDSGDKTSTPLEFLRPHFQKQFSLNLNFSFLLISSRMYRNMRKLCCKFRYSQSLPP